jgi:hypothetical protein
MKTPPFGASSLPSRRLLFQGGSVSVWPVPFPLSALSVLSVLGILDPPSPAPPGLSPAP